MTAEYQLLAIAQEVMGLMAMAPSSIPAQMVRARITRLARDQPEAAEALLVKVREIVAR